jgi:hypothetical protein
VRFMSLRFLPITFKVKTIYTSEHIIKDQFTFGVIKTSMSSEQTVVTLPFKVRGEHKE